MGRLVDSNITKIIQEDPEIRFYDLCHKFASTTISKLPKEAQEKMLRAAKDSNDEVRKVGEKTFLFLNIKTIIRVADNYFIEGIAMEERDDLLMKGLVGVKEKIPDFSTSSTISGQVYNAAQAEISNYLAEKANAHVRLVDSYISYRIIVSEVEREFKNGRLTAKEIDDLSIDLSERTHIDIAYIRDYIDFRKSQVSLEQLPENAAKSENIFQEVSERLLKEALYYVMDSLTQREEYVLYQRFGLDGEEATLEELGKNLGVCQQRICQIEATGLRKLRHPSRARRLKPYLNLDLGTDENYIDYVAYKAKQLEDRLEYNRVLDEWIFGSFEDRYQHRNKRGNQELGLEINKPLEKDEEGEKFELKTFGIVGSKLAVAAKTLGISRIGDLFGLPEEKIKEILAGNKTLIRKIIWRSLFHLYEIFDDADKCVLKASNTKLIYHVSNAILLGDKEKALNYLNECPRDLRIALEREIQFIMNGKAVEDLDLYTRGLAELARMRIFAEKYKKLDVFYICSRYM